MEALLLTMIALPLLGSILNGLILKPPFPKRAGVIATLFAAGSFVIAVTLFLNLLSTDTPTTMNLPWFKAGSVDIGWGFVFDRLTAVMALFITGIGTLIHIYSIGYMSEEPTPSRFFAYLNLFLCNMLILITGDNLVVLFVGWEGVGLCSYLLIGYWYQDVEKANAGIKAFVVNRIGDAGFLIGIFLCIQLFNSVSFSAMARLMPQLGQGDLYLINLTALFLFIGAMGKSAQVPLFVWLPDAMAGPTPVSALIHAATMVTAGIYLILRMSFLFHLAHDTNFFIAAIGVATSLLAALIATSQRDIKKVLAYSTVSQLGLIFMGLGCGAYFAAIFHVVTHAFFKALLFLGAGSVIHGLHGEQDIFEMGGLRKKLPHTFLTFAIGTLAIAGIPPLAGFFSKDMLLYGALTGHYGTMFWLLGLVTSALTAFYMTRLFAMVFLGQFRGPETQHPHESPAVMTLPLWILAVGSALAGFLGVPHEFHIMPNFLGDFLAPVLPATAHGVETAVSEFAAMGIATASAFFFSALALWLYSDVKRAESFAGAFKPLRFVFENKFWVDELYGVLFVKPFQMLSTFLARFFDPKVIDAAVMAPSQFFRASSSALSLVQTGLAQFYLLIMLLGALGVFWLCLRGAVA